MDTSKEYILMCEKAVEIQELRADLWDWASFIEKNPNQKPCALKKEHYIYENNIWLPRQDQLQEMCRGMEGCLSFKDIQGDIWRINKFATPNRSTFPDYIKSWEQLWLAYVMSEKHNKLWNGNNWEGER